MKYLLSSPADLPYRLVNDGVDTLVLNVRYADPSGVPCKGDDALLPDHLIACLTAWQAVAREQDGPVVTPLVFHDAALQIYPHGAGKGQWRWLLTCPSFTLAVSRGRLNGVVAHVRLSSPYLWSSEDTTTHRQDIWSLMVELHDFLSVFFTGGDDLMALQVSELHLCADVAGWDVSTIEWQRCFLSRARTRIDHPDTPEEAGGPGPVVYVGRRLSTLNFGTHGSPLSCCIYDKLREIKVSHKLWMPDLWKRHGWDGSSPVWRVEFRWKREALHEIRQEGVFHGIESLEDLGLPSRISSLWTYAAGHIQGGKDGLPDGWLRCALPSETDPNPSRWEVAPAWQVVQSAFTTETEPAVHIPTGEVVDLPVSPLAVLIRQRHYEMNIQRLSQQVGGCAATLAAWLGGTSQSMDDLPSVLTWLIDHLPAYALPDLAKVAPLELLQAAFQTAFAEKIEHKRAIYGVSTPEKKTDDCEVQA